MRGIKAAKQPLVRSIKALSSRAVHHGVGQYSSTMPAGRMSTMTSIRPSLPSSQAAFDPENLIERYFSSTSRLCKKGKNPKSAGHEKHHAGKHSHSADPRADDLVHHDSSTSPGAAGRPKPNPEDPSDLADLTFALDKMASHHTAQLQRQRVGGRFNPDALGRLAVRPDKASPQTFPLSELATVAHQGGRHVAILAHEKEHVRAIMSAVQGSPDFNQQPQPSPDNELELLVRIEAERPDALARRVRETCHAWREQVRAERQKRLKVHDRWKAEKVVVPDDKARLDKEVERVVEKQMQAIDAKEKEALRHLEKKP